MLKCDYTCCVKLGLLSAMSLGNLGFTLNKFIISQQIINKENPKNNVFEKGDMFLVIKKF